jgi:hypothetical protein
MIKANEVPYDWIRTELEFSGVLKRESGGERVKVIQEWLSLHGYGVSMDGAFGPVTEHALLKFQTECAPPEFQTDKIVPGNGIIDEKTLELLTSPMLRALTPIPMSKPYNEMVLDYTFQHLTEHPREIGGQNCGPWVRLYMLGNDGRDYAWCAGFVSFILRQAADSLGVPVPLEGSFSCDVLAERAKTSGLFVSEHSLNDGTYSITDLPAGSIFLVRRTANDWTHTGLVTGFREDVFETVEGNTNDEGSREGYEVCARQRGYKNKDFIIIQ